MAIADRFEEVGQQHTLDGGASISITQFKNIKQKKDLKAKVLQKFDGQMFRSVIKPREIDNNVRLNKLDRSYERGNSDQASAERLEKFSQKTIDTISTFPTTLTFVYTNLLSKEGEKVFDPFMGHNSRAEDVLALRRKYYAYDVHLFPIDFTKKAVAYYPPENYDLTLGSSEHVKYEDETFDMALTCPPYAYVEKYNDIYKEDKAEDLSSKDYEEFLRLYAKCLKETFRVLKRGKYFVIVVGNFIDKGKYINLMNDTIYICNNIGFNLHDINIYNRGSNIGGDFSYPRFILQSHRLPCIHEYILVFKKSEEIPLKKFGG